VRRIQRLEKIARRSSWYIASERYHDAGRPFGGGGGCFGAELKRFHIAAVKIMNWSIR
jgi:hypothetical protein